MISKAKAIAAPLIIARIIDNQFGGTARIFAESIGVKPSTVSGWLHGRNVPRSAVEQISRVHGVPLSDFYGNADNGPEPNAECKPGVLERLASAEAENARMKNEIEQLRSTVDRLLGLLEVQQSNQAGRVEREMGGSGRRVMPHSTRAGQ